MLRGRGHYTSVELAAYKDLHVIPFNKYIKDDCSQPLDTDERTGAKMRRIVYEKPLHPFVELSHDDLEAMAHTDAAAVLMTERFFVTAIAALDPRPRTIKV